MASIKLTKQAVSFAVYTHNNYSFPCRKKPVHNQQKHKHNNNNNYTLSPKAAPKSDLKFCNTTNLSTWGGRRRGLGYKIKTQNKVTLGVWPSETLSIGSGGILQDPILLLSKKKRSSKPWCNMMIKRWYIVQPSTNPHEISNEAIKQQVRETNSYKKQSEDTNQSVLQNTQTAPEKLKLDKEAIELFKKMSPREKWVFLRQLGIQFGVGLWEGTKKLWYNAKTARALKRKEKEVGVTRAEYRFVHQYHRDIKKVIPLLVVWKLGPFASLWLPFAFMVYPHVLPSTFKLAEPISKQKLIQSTMENKKALLEKRGSATDLPAYIQMLQRKPLSASYVISLNLPKLSTKNLDKLQLAALLVSLGHPPLWITYWPKYFLRIRADRHLSHLRKDDTLLNKEGLDTISEVQILEEACLERGLAIKELQLSDLQRQMVEWLKLSLQDAHLPETLLIYTHCFVYNELQLGQ